MILDSRKLHRHNAPPSWIDPSLYHDGCASKPGFSSSLLHASALSQAHNLPWDQAQKATSKGRRRETPSDPRPSACGSTTHQEYFGGARHVRIIGVRPPLRAARENAVRKLLVSDGERWRAAKQRKGSVGPAFACNAPTRARTLQNFLGHAPQIDAEQPESTSPAGGEKTCDARSSEQFQHNTEG